MLNHKNRVVLARGYWLYPLLVGLTMFTAPAQAQVADREAIVAAARSEGKLVLYNATGFPIVRKLSDLFERKYKIPVEVLDGRASEIRERIRSEQVTGRRIGDMIFTGNTGLTTMQAAGFFQPHGGLPNAANIESPLTDNGTVTPALVGNFAVLINTNLIKPGDEPKSWRDLTDPKWRGKILADDPRAPGGAQMWFDVMLNTFGREFHDKFAEQNPVFSRVWAESARRIARGEFQVYLPFNVAEIWSLQGLPLKVLMPVEGVPYLTFGSATLKDAPRPNAARLFLNFTLETEAQLLLAGEGYRPAVKGMEAHIPKERLAAALPKLLATNNPAQQDALMKLATEIYK